MRTIEVVRQLQRYFDFKIIGSWLLVEKAGLSEKLVNDIDVMIVTKNQKIRNVRSFLYDIGFKETERERDEEGYQFVQGSLVFKNRDYDLPIHILISKENIDVYSLGELIAKKFDRGFTSDITQLKSIINKM